MSTVALVSVWHYYQHCCKIPDRMIEKNFGLAISAEQAIDLAQHHDHEEQQDEIDAMRQEIDKQAVELHAIKQQLAQSTATT